MSAITTITGTGVLNAVPTTTTLTIGGITYDLSQNRTWSISGLTSIGLSVPTGFSVTNSPLTANGTIALSFSSGYSLPTTVKQSNWDDAYTFVTGFPSQSTNNGKYLTTDGSALSWATIPVYTLAGLGGVPTSRTITINGTTQDLSANRSWTISGASPAGASGEIQFNNGGAFAGAANVEIDAGDLVLIDAGFPSAPSSGKTKVFTDSMAGRRLVSSIDPDGFHYDFQPALFNSTTYLWLAGTGTTLAINWGTSYTARNNGTGAAQATPAKASTNAVTSMNRATYSTGSTATGASGIQSTETTAWLGNAANLGGFFFFARFALEAVSGTSRFFVGISANNATMAADSSSWNNTIGICRDSGDTTMSFVLRNNGTQTIKRNTTITPSTTEVYDIYIFAKPNATQIDWELRNAVTNAVLANNSETGGFPSNTVFMYMQSHIQSTSGTTPKLLALNRMYLESNL